MQFAALHFDTSVEEVFLTLCAGATLVVRSDDMTDSVSGFLDACARLRITFLDLPTAYWHELSYAISTGAAALPAEVHTVVIGGEAALPERVDRWRKAVGTSVRLLNTYGPTEATVVATVADLHDPSLAPGDVPIGLPLPGTRAAVVDGELHLLGDNLAVGYRGDRPPDAARFAPLHALPRRPVPTAPATSYGSATTGSCAIWAGRTPSSRSAVIACTLPRSRAPSWPTRESATPPSWDSCWRTGLGAWSHTSSRTGLPRPWP